MDRQKPAEDKPHDKPCATTLAPTRLIGAAAAALALGAMVGFAIWALLSTAYALTDLVWVHLAKTLDLPFFPLVACTLGGVAMGLWNTRFASAPKPFNEVMAEVRATSGYSVGRLVPSSVSFLLPIAFGGSVGPEAGLTGLIAAGCTWVGSKLKRMANITGSFARRQKIPLYTLGVLGGIGGIALHGAVLGGGMPLPRFDAAALCWSSAAWSVPLAVLGWTMAIVYMKLVSLAKRASHALDKHTILKPILCGIALGTCAIALPYVLFPGGAQATELSTIWTTMPPVVLFATGFAKLAFIALCLNFGWNGGPFFPLIFCGVSVGFGFAGAFGVDASLCVTVVTAGLMAGFTRKPTMALLTMLICFPIASLPWIAIGILVGMLLPMPGMKTSNAKRSEQTVSDRGFWHSGRSCRR